MGNFKFAKDLFLEVAELNRFKKFLIDDGYKADFKNAYEQLGIVYNQYYDPNFNYFQVKDINVADTVYVNPGFAYDINRNVLTSAGNSLLIPARNIWYWLKINYKFNNIEQGTVTIGGTNGGLMTGIGTEFTNVLRGQQSNFPSKIKFLNSVNYQQEYELNEVTDDLTAYLQGSFPVKETGLQYAIIGTFTPGVYPPDTDKYPFQYDDFNYTFVAESGNDVMPSFVEGNEFYIARVMSTDTGVQIQDRRNRFLARTRTERLYSELPTKPNPLIGIEYVNKTAIRSKLYYTVGVQWGVRIVVESRNYNLNKVTITTANGGIYNTINSAQTNDFDGWRYYYANGDYSRILSSIKNGTSVDLLLDVLKSESIGVLIVPNAEELEVQATYKIPTTTAGVNAVYKQLTYKFYVNTLNPQLVIDSDELDAGFQEVDIQYRYKTVLNLNAFNDFNLSTYVIQGLGQATNKNILFTATDSSGGGTQPTTGWRGIQPTCITDVISPTIYYKIQTGSPTSQPTEYFPNTSFVQTSTDRTTAPLNVLFYSDTGRTTPVNVTHNNLRIIVKDSQSQTNTTYDIPNTGDTNSSVQVVEQLLIYVISPVGVNNMTLDPAIETENKTYQHPTNDILTRRIIFDGVSTYSEFPAIPDFSILAGNTGFKSFATLEEYYLTSGIATGNTKPNVNTDPDYIAPVNDTVNCTTTPSFINLSYGYKLNVKQVSLNGSITGTITGTNISDTQDGGYSYVLPPYTQDEQVTLTVRIATLDTGNTSGSVWVRVYWLAPGATNYTFTQVQVTNDTVTTLSQIFTNIQSINISNF